MLDAKLLCRTALLTLMASTALLVGAVPNAAADDQCKPAAPLPQSKCTKDSQCCAGLVCPSGRCQGGCNIGTGFQTSGQRNVAPNNCQSCQPAVSTTAWTNVAAGTVCRPSAGTCDLAETCTGTSATCPSDAKSTAGCRPAAGACDLPESCDGVSNDCPPDAKSLAVCRPGAGACDVTESCNGVSNDCPADAKSTAVCRAAGGPCDLAESCDGVNNNCPADAKSTAVCRFAAGACDLAESCDGVNDNCPADTKSTAVCRPAAGACDLPESCDGVSNDCPADAKSVAACRPAAGACDLAESCNGVSNDCPADAKSTAVCRPATNPCEIAETCDGSSDTCPVDVSQPDGTTCPGGSCCSRTCVDSSSDPNNCGTCANVCSAGEACSAGACTMCSPNCGGCGVPCPVAGEGWDFDDAGQGCHCIFGTCSCCSFGCSGKCGTEELTSHVVTFVVAGLTLSFKFAPVWDGCITGAEAYIAHWIGTPGHDNSGATLSGGGEGTPLFNLNDGTNELVDQGTFNLFTAQTFTITFPNGDHYVVDGTTGLVIPQQTGTDTGTGTEVGVRCSGPGEGPDLSLPA